MDFKVEEVKTATPRLSLRPRNNDGKSSGSRFSSNGSKFGTRGFNKPRKHFDRTKDRQKGMVNAFVQGKGQNAALKWLMESRVPVSVFLVTGVKFEGLVSAFDAFTIKISDLKHNQQLIYKDKISTITIKKPDGANHGKKPFMSAPQFSSGKFQGENGMSMPLAGDENHDDGVTLSKTRIPYQG